MLRSSGSWVPKGHGWTIACFATGVCLFAVGAHLSFVNIAPQQARMQARKEFVKEFFKKKFGE
ncbi:hypothetical protein ACHQM5_009014 [Ranunculus cassubicifolius]